MQSVDYHSAMVTCTGTETTQKQCLVKIARHWDSGIRRELRRFAQYLWPDTHLLGLVPLHGYRLRKRLESETLIWWVERDIPPYDRYRCEAYSVELNLAGPAQPQLVVRTGISAYPILPISMEGLKITLVQAGADTPLVIRREFEPALDP
jgi:hypothetical protein